MTVFTDLRVAAVEAVDSSSEEADVDDDGEGDFAPFMVSNSSELSFSFLKKTRISVT